MWIDRFHGGGLALAIGGFASTLSLASPLAQVALVATGLQALWGKWPAFPRLVWVAVGILVTSSLVATYTALWYWGNTGAASLYVLWTMLMVLVLVSRSSRWTWYALVPFWWFQAILIIRQASTEELSHLLLFPPHGTMDSRNVAGGFMALGIIWAFAAKKPLLAVPMIPALLLTGSRLSLGVTVICLVGLLLQKRISVTGIVSLALVVAVYGGGYKDVLAGVYRIHSANNVSAAEKVQDDALARLRPATWPSIIPQGPIGMTEDTHNVLLRMSIEQGILAAVAWGGLSVAALLRRPRYTPEWWMLLAFMGLTTLEYYPMYPLVLSPFWWVLVGQRLQTRSITSRDRASQGCNAKQQGEFAASTREM